jgi:hypothetical protein
MREESVLGMWRNWQLGLRTKVIQPVYGAPSSFWLESGCSEVGYFTNPGLIPGIGK